MELCVKMLGLSSNDMSISFSYLQLVKVALSGENVLKHVIASMVQTVTTLMEHVIVQLVGKEDHVIKVCIAHIFFRIISWNAVYKFRSNDRN